MEGIYMSQSEADLYRDISNVLEGRLSIKELSIKTDKSYRQAKRDVARVRELGLLGVAHGNLGRTPHNKTDPETEVLVANLLRGRYQGFNLTHFKEKLEADEGLKLDKNVIHRIAKSQGLVKNPKTRRSGKAHPLRARLPQEGMLVQFDGSEHMWFGKFISDLLAAIDDATGKIVAAEFFIGETSLHSLSVIKQMIEAYGIPESFYTDQAAAFGKVDRDWESQIDRALGDLGCRLILAKSPQAKGRVERLFGTLQDRLIAELAFNKITTIPQANKYLKEVFIPEFNKKFSVPARVKKSAFRPHKPFNLDLICCKKEKRKIGAGNQFSYGCERLVVNEQKNYRFRSLNINTHLDGTVSYDIMGKAVQVQQLVVKRKNILTDRVKVGT